MRLRSSKHGFTLLEIIIVIIIIGVLTSLALPRLFSMIEYSKSAEALSSMATIRAAIERCFLMHGSYSTCARQEGLLTDPDFPLLGIENPGRNPGASFSYTISGPFVGPVPPGAQGYDYSYIISARYGCSGVFMIECKGTIAMAVYPDRIDVSGTGVFEKIK